jgi:hypothetical protein
MRWVTPCARYLSAAHLYGHWRGRKRIAPRQPWHTTWWLTLRPYVRMRLGTQRRACLTSRHGARVVSCVFAAWNDRPVDRGAADDR